MTENPINNTVTWYYQRERLLSPIGTMPTGFWDTFLHSGCDLLNTQDKNPFEVRNG